VGSRATNDRDVVRKAVAGCDGVLVVPWGVDGYSTGTAHSVLDYAASAIVGCRTPAALAHAASAQPAKDHRRSSEAGIAPRPPSITVEWGASRHG